MLSWLSMKTRRLLAFCCLLAAGTARAQDFAALADATISSSPLRDASVGVVFAALDDGATVYVRHPDLPLVPASDAKLAVTAAALEDLKPDFRFRTSFLAKKKESGARSLSVVVWRGSGDPSISGRGRSGPYEIFELWGATLAARGVEKIGRLILDNRAFDGPAVVSSWPAGELSYWYAAETSAISFNDNCVNLHFYPGPRAGRRAKIVLDPDFGYIRAINRTTTAPSGSRFTIDYRRRPDADVVDFFGAVGATDAVHSDYVSVHQPALFAADVLRRVWRKKGPRVASKAVFWEKSGLAEDQLEEISSWESEPLSEIVKVINKNSQNLYAEQLLKTLGAKTGGQGSFVAGLASVRRFLDRAGLAGSDYRLADGSGLSEENRLTAMGLVKILRFMRSSPNFPAYFDSLAIPGVDKSALDRMKGEPSAGQMRLKRGTTAHARNLAGYLQSRSGRLYAFAILVNGPSLDRPAIDAAADRICIGAARLLP